MDNGADAMIATFENHETPFHYCGEKGNEAVAGEMIKYLHAGQIQLGVNKQSKFVPNPL